MTCYYNLESDEILGSKDHQRGPRDDEDGKCQLLVGDIGVFTSLVRLHDKTVTVAPSIQIGRGLTVSLTEWIQ